MTRREVADYVGNAFELLGTLDRRELVEMLAAHEAPAELRDLVSSRVPEGTRLGRLEDLWQYLGDLPEGRESP
ncbi:MAG TPA: hypothetical protein VHF23_01650 [Gaiellaceae bacterium]|nr:hypothetical protein [Gaiellaceae bacterium]